MADTTSPAEYFRLSLECGFRTELSKCLTEFVNGRDFSKYEVCETIRLKPFNLSTGTLYTGMNNYRLMTTFLSMWKVIDEETKTKFPYQDLPGFFTYKQGLSMGIRMAGKKTRSFIQILTSGNEDDGNMIFTKKQVFWIGDFEKFDPDDKTTEDVQKMINKKRNELITTISTLRTNSFVKGMELIDISKKDTLQYLCLTTIFKGALEQKFKDDQMKTIISILSTLSGVPEIEINIGWPHTKIDQIENYLKTQLIFGDANVQMIIANMGHPATYSSALHYYITIFCRLLFCSTIVDSVVKKLFKKIKKNQETNNTSLNQEKTDDEIILGDQQDLDKMKKIKEKLEKEDLETQIRVITTIIGIIILLRLNDIEFFNPMFIQKILLAGSRLMLHQYMNLEYWTASWLNDKIFLKNSHLKKFTPPPTEDDNPIDLSSSSFTTSTVSIDQFKDFVYFPPDPFNNTDIELIYTLLHENLIPKKPKKKVEKKKKEKKKNKTIKKKKESTKKHKKKVLINT